IVECDKNEDERISKKEFECAPKDLLLKNPAQMDSADDVSTLLFLHEASLLYNLQHRYDRDAIYTYNGPVLIAINPNKNLPDSLYGSQTIEAYTGQPLGSLSPHVYAIADEAFRNLMSHQKDQSILVSGSSGSGKTETTKHLLRYFAAMSKKSYGSASLSPSNATPNVRKSTSIENQIINSMTVLVSFW
ncbi:hypothetical protein AKO1_015150, partial [Acrasis kona]